MDPVARWRALERPPQTNDGRGGGQRVHYSPAGRLHHYRAPGHARLGRIPLARLAGGRLAAGRPADRRAPHLDHHPARASSSWIRRRLSFGADFRARVLWFCSPRPSWRVNLSARSSGPIESLTEEHDGDQRGEEEDKVADCRPDDKLHGRVDVGGGSMKMCSQINQLSLLPPAAGVTNPRADWNRKNFTFSTFSSLCGAGKGSNLRPSSHFHGGRDLITTSQQRRPMISLAAIVCSAVVAAGAAAERSAGAEAGPRAPIEVLASLARGGSTLVATTLRSLRLATGHWRAKHHQLGRHLPLATLLMIIRRMLAPATLSPAPSRPKYSRGCRHRRVAYGQRPPRSRLRASCRRRDNRRSA